MDTLSDMKWVKHWFSVLVHRVERSPSLCFLLLLILAVIGFLPASIDFLHGHDALGHLVWNIEFLEVLRAGTLYPRWLPDMNQGDGSPFFVFYSPLFSYITAAFSWKLGVIQGMKIASFLFWWGSGVAMFICARRWLSRPASLATALVYLFLPYHVYDLHVRAALAELGQFLWLPLIVLALDKLQRGGMTSVAALAFCVAGAILTHLVTAVIFLYLLAAIGFLALFRSRPFGAKIIIAIAWGLVLSSVYLLPAFWERRFINPVLFLTGHADYSANFLFSPANTPYQKAALLWALVQAALLTPLLLVCGLTSLDKNSDFANAEMVSTLRYRWLTLGVLAVFMMLPFSAFLWKLPGLRYLIFPWRWLLVGSFAASLLAGLQSSLLQHTRPIWRAATLIILAANLCLAAVAWSHRMAQGLVHNHDWYRNSAVLENVKYRSEPNSPPKWVPRVEERLVLSEKARNYGTGLEPPATVVEGSGTTEILEWAPNKRQVTLEARTPVVVSLRTFYFPGWKCQLDGETVPIEISPEGRIAVSVPAGYYHLLSCAFSNTPVRTLGRRISLMGLLAAFFAVVLSPRRNHLAGSSPPAETHAV